MSAQKKITKKAQATRKSPGKKDKLSKFEGIKISQPRTKKQLIVSAIAKAAISAGGIGASLYLGDKMVESYGADKTPSDREIKDYAKAGMYGAGYIGSAVLSGMFAVGSAFDALGIATKNYSEEE